MLEEVEIILIRRALKVSYEIWLFLVLAPIESQSLGELESLIGSSREAGFRKRLLIGGVGEFGWKLTVAFTGGIEVEVTAVGGAGVEIYVHLLRPLSSGFALVARQC